MQPKTGRLGSNFWTKTYHIPTFQSIFDARYFQEFFSKLAQQIYLVLQLLSAHLAISCKIHRPEHQNEMTYRELTLVTTIQSLAFSLVYYTQYLYWLAYIFFEIRMTRQKAFQQLSSSAQPSSQLWRDPTSLTERLQLASQGILQL